MNHKFDLQQSIGLLLIVALILGAVTLLVMREGNTEAIQLPSLKPINSSKEPVVDLAGQERTVEISAYRWQAMADYYEKHGLLTRDGFDYEQAVENQAYRWQAMADYYKKHGLLTRDDFDYEQAAENQAYRWQAMVDYYKKHGLLTHDNFD